VNERILIAGGYGEVGGRIARDLAANHAGRVIVAGRNLERAAELAAELGAGTQARRIDVHDPSSFAAALDGVGVVVSCIDQPERHLLRAAIDRGLAYTDITPHTATLSADLLDALRETAAARGAAVILGAGIVPGISSVLARAAVARLGGVDRIDTALLLSAGDLFGPASASYLIEELSAPFRVTDDGQERQVEPFSEPAAVDFPDPIGRQEAFLFPFSDQVFYSRTLGVRTALTRLALDPSWLATALRAALRLGVPQRFASAHARDRLASVFHQIHRNRDDAPWALVVDARGANGRLCQTLIGHTQANAAAVGGALVARSLERDRPPPGVWLPEQVLDTRWFLDELGRRGLVVVESRSAQQEPALA
jgi:saccharopine dehydrogenase-like NADP-dependent oxidoreductase